MSHWGYLTHRFSQLVKGRVQPDVRLAHAYSAAGALYVLLMVMARVSFGRWLVNMFWSRQRAQT